MKKILLIVCPPFWTKLPPLSLTYLKSVSKNIDILDLNIELYNICKNKNILINWENNNFEYKIKFFEKLLLEENIKKYIEKLIIKIKKYNYIGFSVFKSNYNFTIQLTELLRLNNYNGKFIFGGPETLVRKFKKNDIVVFGEGENFLLDFFKYKNILNNSFNEIKKLDELPFLDFDSFDLKKYKVKRCLPLLMSRGCINKCKFCSEKNLYKKYKFRQHSPEYMFNLIKYLKEKYKINWFIFQDSLINGNLKYLKKLCEMIVDYNLNIKWEGQVYIRNDMSIELLELMKKAGCYNMFIGLESGSDEILLKMNKGYTSEIAYNFFEKCRKLNMFFEISLIVGFPGETQQTIEETKNFLKKNYIPKIAQINRYIFYKLSEVENKEVHYDFDIENIINDFVLFFKENKIKYTPAFINNLY